MYNVHRYNITVCRVGVLTEGPADQFLEPCMCYYLEKTKKGREGKEREGREGKEEKGREGKGREGKGEREGKEGKGR
jgi:hypothetical protein